MGDALVFRSLHPRPPPRRAFALPGGRRSWRTFAPIRSDSVASSCQWVSKGPMPRGDHRPQLCLVIEATAASSDDTLRAALGAADVVAVLLAAATGRELEAGTVAPLVAAAQAHGAAALVEGD